MTKVMTRVIEELKDTLQIERESMDKADGMDDCNGNNYYKGWVEALEYSIRLIENESIRGKND